MNCYATGIAGIRPYRFYIIKPGDCIEEKNKLVAYCDSVLYFISGNTIFRYEED